jgi:hypothetical protein
MAAYEGGWPDFLDMRYLRLDDIAFQAQDERNDIVTLLLGNL